MSVEQPFKISLDDTRLPDEINAAEWAYGVPLADISRLLNALPMFTRTIAVEGFGELSVHYVHQRSTVEGAIPLLFVHGWPGSFLEVTKILPLLTGVSPENPSLHVVAPSLPGYAWSEGVLEKGFQAKHYAELFNKLMISLGYSEYVTQGGDWGHVVTLTAASKYGPQHVKACHTNMPLCEPPKRFGNPIVLLKCLITSFTAREREAVAVTKNFLKNGMGYFFEQSTKPQTLGFSLADSPVGLLAWIYEKLVTWTDAYPWTDDEVLTWVSIYWFSRAGPAASVRIYYEFERANTVMTFPKTSVPVGLSFFPKEIIQPPKALLRSKGKIVFESEHKVGGHFAAYEQPEALVGDLREMFGKSGPAAGVVPGCTGY
ncbi:alpha/beta-hydrolase [Lactarius quietus]|nr:alpha/beta-hydrolase [Lactarius quietus]